MMSSKENGVAAWPLVFAFDHWAMAGALTVLAHVV